MPKGVRTNFNYHVPFNTEETLQLLHKYGKLAKIIAGGTDLIPKIKAGTEEFDEIISLKNVKELATYRFDENGTLHIGSMVRLAELEKDLRVKEAFPALWEGIHSMANTQIRNRGTITGNICNAVPSCDTAPALIVYDASVVIRNIADERVVPITEFFTGVCQTCLAPDELVTEILVPARDPDSSSVYYKYAVRKALDLAMVGVASNVSVKNGVAENVKLALGAVAIVPKRAAHAEALLQGRPFTKELIDQAAEIASQEDCKPISDIRATADYRREMVRIHVRDALNLAAGIKSEVMV